MPKPQKVEAVSELTQGFRESKAALLAEFRGLKVDEMKDLRRTLAEGGTRFKVVKNTLSRIAAREAQLEELIPMLEGSTAIAFISGDPVTAAKGLDEMAKKYPSLVVKGGILDGAVLDGARARSLAKVLPREALLSQLAGMLQTPLQQMVNVLSAPLRQLGYVLGAYQQKLEAEGPPAPAEAPAAPETPATTETPEASVEAPEPVAEAPEPTETPATAETPESAAEEPAAPSE